MTSSLIRLAARTVAVIAALMIVSTVRAEAQDSVDWNAYKKSVEAGHRDTIPQNAYQGWKQYELNCARCHGEYGVGTSFAPALIESLKAGKFDEFESMVALFQQTSQRLKYALVPTVAAVEGMALGGGCEFVMHSQRVVAALESYIGLVEIGVGLLPAGGGLKEFAVRVNAWANPPSAKHRMP